MSEISNDVNRSISKLINKGNGTYYTHKITIYISIAVMILALIGYLVDANVSKDVTIKRKGKEVDALAVEPLQDLEQKD